MPPSGVSSDHLEQALNNSALSLGRSSVSEIVPEVMPVLEALAAVPPQAESDDLDSFEFRECFALITLLGRRLALLDLTPTGALGICATTLRLTAATDSFARSAMAACMEGFVRGREERIQELQRARADASVTPLRVSPRAWLLMPSGIDDPDLISKKVDELARSLFEQDAEVALIDFSQMGEPSADKAAALLSADEMAKMLGTRCIFVGLDEPWRVAAQQAGVDLSMLTVASDLAEGLSLADGGAYPKSPPSALGRLWRKWKGLSGRGRR